MNVLRGSRWVCFVLICGWASAASAQEYLLADGRSWPGVLLWQRGVNNSPYLVRPLHQPAERVPRVQSVTTLPDGRVIFASGLDRVLMEATPSGERMLRQGGYLARQVRTSADGLLYWSGLETPRDDSPLPDGFIYNWNPRTGETQTVLTFSQGDVGRDWWGAFDVRQGHILIGTFQAPSRIYEVSVSPVQQVATLPFSATAFRFDANDHLWACDGRGKLYRFTQWSEPQRSEVVLESATPFVDFALLRPAARP